MMRPVFHVDLDAFFVSVERRYNPALNGKPVVVGAEPGVRGVVASASYEARAYGLRAGMPLARARRLCPQAIFLPGNFPRYREASHNFLEILADFTPDLEPLGIDEAYLDLTGFEPLYGPPRGTALEIKRRIERELGLTASIGIASSKLVAKVASDLSKPDGLLEVPVGEEKAFLAPLPVISLPGVGPKAEQALAKVGIRTVAELAAAPPAFLKQTFGLWGETLHRFANGIDGRRVEPPPPPKSISRETTFPQDTGDRPLLQATLGYLSERVGAELRQEGKQARCVVLKLRYADFQSLTRSCTLKEPTDAHQVILGVGLELLEKALAQRPQLVRLVGIGVSGLIPRARQLHLFDRLGERWEGLNQALDRLRGKYGFLSIQTGRTLPLGEVFRTRDGDYVLKTPCLSR